MIPANLYSWREFGREAEYVVGSILKLKGWKVRFSPSSRGPADIIASKSGTTWCIQVKSSLKSPHIKSQEISKLNGFARSVRGIAVFASFQPWCDNQEFGFSIGQYKILLYSLEDWKLLQP